MESCDACRTLAIALIALFVSDVRALGQAPPSNVVAAPVVEQEVSTGHVFVGTVMPAMKATVGSAVEGRVIEFPMNEGDRVERGQVLAQLLTDTINLEIAAAEAELDLRSQHLKELENGTRAEEIEQAKARMNGAEAKMKYLAGRRARVESLYANNRALSEEERDEAVAAAIEAEQAYIEAKQAYDLAVAGPRAEQIAQSRAQVAMAQAAVNQLKDQLSKHTVVARFAGYVTAEHTEVGQWVKQGDPVAEIAAMDEVEVVTHVVEQHVPYARVGTVVRVEVPALPGRMFTGEICAVVPQADVQARTFPVKVRVKNELSSDGPLLKSGMYARMMLATGDRHTAMMVPKDALVLGGPAPTVYVVAPPGASPGPPSGPPPSGAEGRGAPQSNAAQNGAPRGGIARPVHVQLGVADGELIQVTGALKVGDLVVVQGNERLHPGQSVHVQRIVGGKAPAAEAASLPLPADPPLESRRP